MRNKAAKVLRKVFKGEGDKMTPEERNAYRRFKKQFNRASKLEKRIFYTSLVQGVLSIDGEKFSE